MIVKADNQNRTYMKKIVFILSAVLSIGLFSCKEDIVGQYPVEYTSPDTISNISYVSLPGAVRLTYRLPSDMDLMSVVATYSLDNGTKMEAAASAFTNSILLEGFGRGDSLRSVSIVTVDLNKNKSVPVTIQVMPLESPIFDVMRSLKTGVDFGGIYLKWKNPLKSKIIVVVTTPNKAGKPEVTLGGKYYSSSDSSIVNVRGYDTIPRDFYIQVTDRWGNKTKMDTVKQVVPMFEEMIPKVNHRKWNPTDIPYQEYSSSAGIALIWNDKWGLISNAECYSTASGGNKTNSITYDLNYLANPATGVGNILPSRVHIYGRSVVNADYKMLPKYVRVWGTTSPNVLTTNTAGPDSWILLSPPEGFLIAPPSGASGTAPTAADKTFIVEEGIDLIFDPGKPAIRYVRLECVSKWDNSSPNSFNYAEVSWYGRVIR